jgi:hypothetical protein
MPVPLLVDVTCVISTSDTPPKTRNNLPAADVAEDDVLNAMWLARSGSGSPRAPLGAVDRQPVRRRADDVVPERDVFGHAPRAAAVLVGRLQKDRRTVLPEGQTFSKMFPSTSTRRAFFSSKAFLTGTPEVRHVSRLC